MFLGHVLGQGGMAVGLVGASMAGDTLAFVEGLDGR
jgi:hypothetical protein